MRITRILNNNVIEAVKDGREVVAMGKGVAFGRKVGETLPDELPDKLFELSRTPANDHLRQLLDEIPQEYWELAPWRLEGADMSGTPCEQVLDSLYRYAWGIDHADMEVLESCFDKDVSFGGPAPVRDIDDGLTPRARMLRFMKYKRFKEPVMQHIYKIAGLEVDNDSAVVQVCRYEPHRMGTQKLNLLNYERDFYSGRMEYRFVRRPGAFPEGGWKMTLNTVLEMKVFSEQSNGRRFY